MPPSENTESKQWSEADLLDLFPAAIPAKNKIQAVESRIREAIAQITGGPATGKPTVKQILPYYLRIADKLPDDWKSDEHAVLRMLVATFCSSPVQAFGSGFSEFRTISAKAFSSPKINNPSADSDVPETETQDIDATIEPAEPASSPIKTTPSSGTPTKETLLLRLQGHAIRLGERCARIGEETLQFEQQIRDLVVKQEILNARHEELRQIRSAIRDVNSALRASIVKSEKLIAQFESSNEMLAGSLGALESRASESEKTNAALRERVAEERLRIEVLAREEIQLRQKLPDDTEQQAIQSATSERDNILAPLTTKLQQTEAKDGPAFVEGQMDSFPAYPEQQQKPEATLTDAAQEICSQDVYAADATAIALALIAAGGQISRHQTSTPVNPPADNDVKPAEDAELDATAEEQEQEIQPPAPPPAPPAPGDDDEKKENPMAAHAPIAIWIRAEDVEGAENAENVFNSTAARAYDLTETETILSEARAINVKRELLAVERFFKKQTADEFLTAEISVDMVFLWNKRFAGLLRSSDYHRIGAELIATVSTLSAKLLEHAVPEGDDWKRILDSIEQVKNGRGAGSSNHAAAMAANELHQMLVARRPETSSAGTPLAPKAR